MPEANYNLNKLRDLLGRFVEEELLTPEIVTKVNKSLFQPGEIAPFFRHRELYDTVVYLKDLVESNQLTGIDDLQRYYDKKRLAFRRHMNNVLEIKKDTACEQENPKPVSNSCRAPLSKTAAICFGLAAACYYAGHFLFSRIDRAKPDHWSIRTIDAPTPLTPSNRIEEVL